jgi:hypothetical protein
MMDDRFELDEDMNVIEPNSLTPEEILLEKVVRFTIGLRTVKATRIKVLANVSLNSVSFIGEYPSDDMLSHGSETLSIVFGEGVKRYRCQAHIKKMNFVEGGNRLVMAFMSPKNYEAFVAHAMESPDK